jgi:2,4-dienoyl-CoA reductase-like NADH-dependent reductase (Old Yellow Enzyme family)
VSSPADALVLPRGQSLKNRLAKAAMSERLAEPGGHPGEALQRLYARWASGGAGLLITGNVMVDPEHLGEPGNVALEDDQRLDGFKAWAKAGQAGGTRIWMQLNHPGRQAPRTLVKQPVAPSVVPMRMGGAFATPRALTGNEIESILDRFAASASLAQQAGFDGVQIHGAHGYLVSQFLSANTNRRDDRWGGDASRRASFLLELVRRVKANTTAPFAVGVKLNSADFQRGGFTGEESVEVARALQDLGIDLLEISGGTYEQAAMFAKASTRAREAFFLEHAEKLASELDVPLMLTGGVRSIDGIRQALEVSGVDVVGMGRPLAYEPDLPRRLLDGSADRAVALDLSFGWQQVDGLAEVAWYELQIERMGQGLAPDPGLSRWKALARYGLDHLRANGLRRGADRSA